MTPRQSTTRTTKTQRAKSDNDRLKLRNTEAVKPIGVFSQLEAQEELNQATANKVPIEQISLPSSQPRKWFAPDKMQQLVESIKKDGILQPLLVRPLESERYELVAGERRYRAAQTIGLSDVPVLVREMTDLEAGQFALVENLQREDLNPVEETEGILQLLALKLSCTTEEAIALLYRMHKWAMNGVNNVINQPEFSAVQAVFDEIGQMTWTSFVTNRLALLKLPNDILLALRQGRIEYTKAKAIAVLKDEVLRQQLLETAITLDLSLAQIRERVKEQKQSPEQDLAESIAVRMTTASKIAKKSKALNDPKKRKKLESLLAQIEVLLSIEG
ncbi:ParB/RepB/Spo0J family partition protein [Trichocoleus sp. Lan]|uniref:ParB/RepB/Spo0J family partition protein n=1 Tax=Trichocoleus sp. Lan TaxID=2933927 RepID=UPI003299A6B3